MNELKRIVENIQSVFAESSYPQEFLDAYDQMECLASHSAGKSFWCAERKRVQSLCPNAMTGPSYPFRSVPDC